jgi:ABC-2 type transport system permease protein
MTITPTYAKRFTGGALNWFGAYTLYCKEVRRFLKVPAQTVIAPMATTLLFLAVFSLALGGADRAMAGVPLLNFLAPGLIIMAMMQSSFANASSSLIMAKIQGTIVDLLMTPLGPVELMFGYVFGGATRGLITGAVLLLAVQPFVTVAPEHFGYILFHAVAASIMLALLGLLGGLWAEKFDHISAVTNFVITPLAFLSGTFYSVDRLPGMWHGISQFNPFFYAIDGFRYGFIGRADGDLATGVVVLLVIDVVLWIVCHRLLASGYKLKP